MTGMRTSRGGIATRAIMLALSFALALPAAAAPDFRLNLAVSIGLNGNELDACLKRGRVKPLKFRDGTTFLSVRAGPTVKAREVGRLREGDFVYICEHYDNWNGVVVHPSRRAGECGVTRPSPRVRDYDGSCLSGWASSNGMDEVER